MRELFTTEARRRIVTALRREAGGKKEYSVCAYGFMSDDDRSTLSDTQMLERVNALFPDTNLIDVLLKR